MDVTARLVRLAFSRAGFAAQRRLNWFSGRKEQTRTSESGDSSPSSATTALCSTEVTCPETGRACGDLYCLPQPKTLGPAWCLSRSYREYVEGVKRGVADIEAGRTRPWSEVRKDLGL